MKKYILLFAIALIFTSPIAVATDNTKFPELKPEDFKDGKFKPFHSVDNIKPTQQYNKTYHWSCEDAFRVPSEFKIAKVSRVSDMLDQHLCVSYKITLNDGYEHLTRINLHIIEGNIVPNLTFDEVISLAQSIISQTPAASKVIEKCELKWNANLSGTTQYFQEHLKSAIFLKAIGIPKLVTVKPLPPEKRENNNDMCLMSAKYHLYQKTYLILTAYVPIKDL